MKARGIRLGWGVAVGLAFAVGAGCATPADPAADGLDVGAFGSLRVPLVTPEQAAYRLRGALFDIVRRSGTDPVVTLDSEAQPEATALDIDLSQGPYEVTLRSGWSLEGLEGGRADPVPAALLTANPLGFDVSDGRVTELVYAFATEQGSVRLGQGSASIEVSVVPAAPSSACSVLDPSSCGVGRSCLLAGDSARTYCATPGDLPVGSPCSSEQCVAGAQCLGLDPEHPDERVCVEFCRTDSSACGCRGIAADPEVGACELGTSQASVCGNGVIERPPEFTGVNEACDTNGAGPDVLPAGTPAGSRCDASCTSVIVVDDFCGTCMQRACPTQYARVFGVDNLDAQNLLACVAGPGATPGGALPPTSCFFADPAQPLGSLVPCYCGDTPQSTCLASGPSHPSDACGTEIEIASHCSPPVASCVTGSGSDPNVPLGAVLQYLNCQRAACSSECGFPLCLIACEE